MSERDNRWLYAEPTGTVGHYIMLAGFDATGEKVEASFYWPDDKQMTIPRKMVLLEVSEFADLTHRAALKTSKPT